ncbi:protein translocase subunit SecD, partial [Candidatus Kaiserbacteria bacterium]|nr:protein translocase subunit SecD [Candidatus Kaiserbacteria bacterium]
MWQKRAIALVILIVGTVIGWYVYSSQVDGSRPFKLGLDLSGGTQLVYRADLNAIKGSDVADSMASLRDTIERRVNLFGVSEPIVQTEHGGTLAGTSEERLLVELPGVTDTQKAIDLIGETPVLEFRMLKVGAETSGTASSTVNDLFETAAITGKDLKSAKLEFQGGTGAVTEPVVVLQFNAEGARIF